MFIKISALCGHSIQVQYVEDVMIRLVAVDMDGTLLNSKKELPRENRVVIEE